MQEEAGFRNPAKERLRAGDVALGLIVRLARSAEIARIARATGHDFLFIDTQLALFSVETIGHIAQTALACGVAPIVRARSVDDPDIPRLLDNGAIGAVFPDVNNADEARRAVAMCKFAPVGRRALGAGYPIFDYRPKPAAESARILNDATLVVCMVETREGLDNLEAIAAVDGVDVVHIGSNDLLAALGKPGAFGDPEIMEAVARLIAACRANGKWAGLGGERDIARQQQFIRDGVQFLTTHTDIAFLMAEATRRVGELRKAREL